MMGLVRFLIVSSVLVALALGAPAEEKSDKAVAVTDVKKSDDHAVVAQDQSWELFFANSPWSLVGGTILLLGGLGLGFYYFYFYKYLGLGGAFSTAVSDPLNANANGYPNYNNAATAYPNNYYQQVSRSLDTGSTWNWAQVLNMISLAQETYEKFDFQSLDCQKKALCELAQKQTDFGETGRKLSSTLSSYISPPRLLEAVEGLPMPLIIQTYLKEYKEAINQGQSSNKDCANIYQKCKFSLKDTFAKYLKKSSQTEKSK